MGLIFLSQTQTLRLSATAATNAVYNNTVYTSLWPHDKLLNSTYVIHRLFLLLLLVILLLLLRMVLLLLLFLVQPEQQTLQLCHLLICFSTK